MCDLTRISYWFSILILTSYLHTDCTECRLAMESERPHFSKCTIIRTATPKLGATQNHLHTNYCFKDCMLHWGCGDGLIMTVQRQLAKSIKIKWNEVVQDPYSHIVTDISKLLLRFSFDIFQLNLTPTSSTTNSWGWTHLNSIYTTSNHLILQKI